MKTTVFCNWCQISYPPTWHTKDVQKKEVAGQMVPAHARLQDVKVEENKKWNFLLQDIRNPPSGRGWPQIACIDIKAVQPLRIICSALIKDAELSLISSWTQGFKKCHNKRFYLSLHKLPGPMLEDFRRWGLDKIKIGKLVASQFLP